MVIFAEYRVSRQHREAYLETMASAKRKYPGMTLLESADQPGLFLEIWRESADETLWDGIAPLVEGGREKIRVWRFSEAVTD